MKRNWPNLFFPKGKCISLPIKTVNEEFHDWLEHNLGKEELDRIAPPIEEPITITRKKYFECLKESLMEEGLSYFTYKGIENIPDANVLSRIGSKLWERLSK